MWKLIATALLIAVAVTSACAFWDWLPAQAYDPGDGAGTTRPNDPGDGALVLTPQEPTPTVADVVRLAYDSGLAWALVPGVGW